MRTAITLAMLLAAPMVLAAPSKKKSAPAPKPKPDDAPPPAQTAEGGAAPHQEGDYSGVVPGHPPPKKQKGVAKGTLSWIGFEVKNGTSELFFQSLAAFEVTQHVEGSTLVVDLNLTRLGQNTWRQIDTRFFETPIAKAVAYRVGATKKHGAGIEVKISFKNPKDAKEGALRTATEADGMYYAYLDFTGTGTPTTAPATTQDPER